ncbi:MAG: flavodoxin family protein [Actinophytocola sp.]|nr:flavodoxin family protein [Actinophytocola sp.]
MKVLWVFAHPEQRSLNAAVRDEGLRILHEFGHETRESDLYAMGFNPVVGPGDFEQPLPERLRVGAEQERGYTQQTLSEDIRAEQEKVAWADALVVHFPLWWFGPPAILKGWFDRVFVQGFAFGIKGADGRTRRYGDGGLAGKRALLITSVGARESSFGPRGIHGHIDEVLFPVLHGTFFYSGISPLAPLVLYGADRLTETGYREFADDLCKRLGALDSERPLPYRPEHGPDYDEGLVLRPELAPGETGLGVHYRR